MTLTPRRSTWSRFLLPFALAFSLGSAALADGDWEEASRSGNITIYNRSREGSEIKELRAVGKVKAPPWAVKNVIDDVGNYVKFMPYTKESRLIKKDGDTAITYQRINAPLVDNRDYTLKIQDKSRRSKDGKIIYKSTWSIANGSGPAPVSGVVRLTVNEGYWQLEEADGGEATRITYYVYTDPGGGLPTFVANMANSQGIPDLFKAVEKAAQKDEYRQSQPKAPE